jgi:DNA-binding IclR family transcriptional regulator
MATTFLRGLGVLEALAGMRQPASMAAVARRAGLSQPQAFRVLQSLERDGYVDHLGRSGYRIGSRSVALSSLIGPRPALLRAVYPVLARLAATTREAAVLHLRSGADRVLVLGVPAPSGPVRDPAGVLGGRAGFTARVKSRVILAQLPESEIAALDPHGTARPRIERIRQLGYDTSYGENHPGINGISAPLLADNHSVLGSITIAGPAGRLPQPAISRLAGPLTGACRELSPQLASILGPSPGATLDALDL